MGDYERLCDLCRELGAGSDNPELKVRLAQIAADALPAPVVTGDFETNKTPVLTADDMDRIGPRYRELLVDEDGKRRTHKEAYKLLQEEEQLDMAQTSFYENYWRKWNKKNPPPSSADDGSK